MREPWPMVPLSEIVVPIERAVVVEPGKSYRTIGVKWWGEGAYERETIDGAETAAKTLFAVREHDLIINKIWVRHGSTAIATKAVDGCAASNEFPMFEIKLDQAEPRWIHWLTKTRWFWDKCDRLSQGTSGKNRIKPEKFLTIDIPLPPLSEQRRIVARIEALATRIGEAKGLRGEASQLVNGLFHGPLNSVWADNTISLTSIQNILTEDSRNGLGRRPSEDEVGVPILRISAGTSRPDAIVDETDVKYLEVSQKEAEVYRLQSGDVLACRFNGNLSFVGRFSLFLGSTHRLIVYPDKLIRLRFNQTLALPAYIKSIMNSPRGREQIEKFCATTAGNIGISASDLKLIRIPLPPLPEQHRIVEHLDALQAKVDSLRALQTETSAELDALLPSILSQAFAGKL